MKKLTLPILITTIILLVIALAICAFSYRLTMERLDDKIFYLKLHLEKKTAHILDRNKGLTLQQFKEKHGIKSSLISYGKNTVYYNRLYFYFNKESGILESVE